MTRFPTKGWAILACALAAAFAFLIFPFKRTLFVLCLTTLMIPFEVTFITNLDTITSLHWFNTYAALAVPFLATGFGIFLLPFDLAGKWITVEAHRSHSPGRA